MLIGNCGKDPDVRTLDSGQKVANFNIATTDKGYTTKEGARIPDRTEWHNVVVWGGLAKVVEQYVKKGSKLYIEGKLRTRNYDGQDGQKRYIAEIFADNLELLGTRQESQQNQNSNYGGFVPPTTPQFQTANAQDLPDDLPF